MSNPIADKLKTAFSSFVPATCLDIGANTGQFVTEWRKIFPDCEVTSIEPNPHCEKGLRKLGVKHLQCAVSDKIGKLELIVPKAKPNSKGGSFYKEIKFNSLPDDQLLKITVPVTTLDTLFPTKKFDVIKIDVQGAELDVINGGVVTLTNSPYIIIEVSLTPYNQGAPLADIIVARMKQLNFFVQDITNQHNDSKGNVIQLDLLFSKISEHNFSAIGVFKEALGL